MPFSTNSFNSFRMGPILPILEKKITSHDLKIFYIVIFPFSVRPFFQIVFSFVVLPQLITCKGLTIRTMYTLQLYMSGMYGFRVSMHYPPILVLFYLPSVSCNFIYVKSTQHFVAAIFAFYFWFLFLNIRNLHFA